MTITIASGLPAHRQAESSSNAKTSSSDDTPAWKLELMKRPLVELRQGFSLGYEAPTEESSTIALTAPSGKFVDIRFSTLPVTGKDTQVTKQLGNIHGTASAGIATIFFPEKEGSGWPAYNCHAHVQWQHILDSSREFGTDGADMILLADGATMEVGFIEIRGTMKYFKEYWVTPPNKATDIPCLVAELTASHTAKTEGAAIRGMAVRIGDFCQGILQTDTEFWFERWEYSQGSGWVKDTRSNTPQAAESTSGILPCWQMGEKSLELGATMELTSGVWNITEVLY
ncbi:sodium nucleoside cotransporter [Ophiostoma piceae UAMH 11346]|uniref:Sodium nucleoside cotransporter n=1 Tax=Ophiostoma piceae (strain UAMH 11346) TaxID=1262450 RepID=S3CTV2_OPHP1|nr:sodium nucleoside cotransporter [Ophiostoma piceae UAMH 11346]